MSVCFLLFFTAATTYAAPNILDVTNNGTVWTISGTSFGVKATAEPVRFEQFTGETPGADISSGGYWSDSSVNNAGYHTFSNSNYRYGDASNISAEFHYVGNDVQGWVYRQFCSGRAYISLWIKMDYVSMSENPGPQHKTLFLLPNHTYGQYPMIGVTNVFDTDTIDHETINYLFAQKCNVAGCTDQSTFLSTHSAYEGQWYQYAIEYQDSDLNTANGHIVGWKSDPDGVLAINKNTTLNGVATQTDSSTGVITTLNIGFLQVNTEETYFYFDDIYIDNSWARVEIGDNSDYDSCTHREMQIPISWDTDEITITFNKGSFENNSTAYLFVVDENGAISDGRTITVGSASTTRYYLDADGDGYSPGDYQDAESDPGETWYTAGELTSTSGDCNDSDAAINPGATEICGNEVDEDCDGTSQSCPVTSTAKGASMKGGFSG